MVGKLNPQWKGLNAGYTSKHYRIYVRFGKPKKCDSCGIQSAKKYEWANLSGEYKTERSDWKRLCVSCHRLFDGHGIKSQKTCIERYGNGYNKKEHGQRKIQELNK